MHHHQSPWQPWNIGEYGETFIILHLTQTHTPKKGKHTEKRRKNQGYFQSKSQTLSAWNRSCCLKIADICKIDSAGVCVRVHVWKRERKSKAGADSRQSEMKRSKEEKSLCMQLYFHLYLHGILNIIHIIFFTDIVAHRLIFCNFIIC